MKSFFPKKLLQKTVIIFSILSIFCFTQISLAYSFKANSGLDTSAGEAGFVTDNPKDLTSIIGNIILIILSLLGIAFFAYIIYGGVVWMTADGNETKIKKANDIVMNSLYGLIITLSVYVLSYFVIEAVNSGNLIR